MGIFLSIVILVVLVILFTNISEKFRSLHGRINNLEKNISESQKTIHRLLLNQDQQRDQGKEVPSLPKTSIAPVVPETPKTVEPIQQPDVTKPEPEKPVEKQPEAPKPEIAKSASQPIKQQNVPPKVPVQSAPIRKVPVKKVAKPPKPSFLERNPDLEKFIGENLVNKIGITIFVLGVAFFVKYAIDEGWINEYGRVAIGLLCGAGLIGLAHYLRKSFASFSSVLVGGGLAVLYFTIGLAFHSYAMFSQTTAFVLMVLVTGFAVLLALAYDRKELAVLALIGGFGTPSFVSTGGGDYRVLFTYIIILDLGMLTLVYFKKWNIINYIAYIFTYLLFVAMFGKEFVDADKAPRVGFLIFLTAFYLIFFLMHIIYNVRNNRKFGFVEIGLLLSNSAIYFGLGLAIVNGINEGIYNGLFTALIAVFNVIFVFVLYKRKNIDTTLLYLLIGLVLTFASLIAPIQLEGNYITLFWALEAVLLLWLAQKSEIKIIRIASVLVNGLMVISLLMDWAKYYIDPAQDYQFPIVINRAFLTSLVVVGSCVGTWFLLLSEKAEFFYHDFKTRWYSNIFEGAVTVLLYFSIFFELNYQLSQYLSLEAQRFIILGVYSFTYLLALRFVSTIKDSARLKNFLFVLTIPVLVSYIICFRYYIINARNQFLYNDDIGIAGFNWHYPLLVLMIVIVVHFYAEIRKRFTFRSKEGTIALWAVSIFGLIVLSSEVAHLVILNQYYPGEIVNTIHQMVVRTFYPVIWGVSALTLMMLGMKYKLKMLRIISLSLFLITLIKLGLWDLKNISDVGKIIAFILLGAFLLVISFLYQKLKFIIQDDVDVNPDKDAHE